MSRAPAFLALSLAASLAACAPTMGPPPPGMGRGGPDESFRADDFAWSQEQGHGDLMGKLTYKRGQQRFTCNGATVILTPETPWVRRRMQVLYQSTERAAAPSAEVRARTPQAPPGDSSAFIKRAVCDATDKFSFAGLPDGAWYAITIAKPVGGGDSLALMRRVTTRGGRTTNFEF